MDESRVSFQGSGPFHLFVAQSATASAEGGSITVTLRAVLPERGPHQEAASFQILQAQARELAISILRACDEAE